MQILGRPRWPRSQFPCEEPRPRDRVRESTHSWLTGPACRALACLLPRSGPRFVPPVKGETVLWFWAGDESMKIHITGRQFG